MLILQRKQNKWSTKFDPSPFQVVRRKGTMGTGLQNGKYVSQNVSHFKSINIPMEELVASEDESDDMDITAENATENTSHNES